MISNRHRFHGYRALGVVYKFGIAARGPIFSVKARKNDRRRTYRAAVVVGRKIHKSAVVRNRMRRRLYEALRLFEPEFNQPYDIVINVHHELAKETDFDELKGQLKKQLIEAGVIGRPAS